MIITHDMGGLTSHYIAAARTHEQVVIDGRCFSGCTLYTSAEHVCATDRAELFFHAPWHKRRDGRKYWLRRDAEDFLGRLPVKVRVEVLRRGGLTREGFGIYHAEVVALVGACT